MLLPLVRLAFALVTRKTRMERKAALLSNLGVCLSELCRAGEPLEAHTEVVDIYRRLIEAWQGEVEPDLTMTLYNKGNALQALHRAGEALESYAETERIYRCLVEAGQGEFGPDLDRSRRALCMGLLAAGRGNLATRLGRYLSAQEDKMEEMKLRSLLWLSSGHLFPRRLWLAIGLAFGATALAAWSIWALILAVPMGLVSLIGLNIELRRGFGWWRTRNIDLWEIRALVEELEAGERRL
ncbi:hypothetical protein ACGTNG_04600 [Halomonas sp. 1390]|uniref:hypothetical protein n=1 Tax=Halomonas sp. B23F22_3 TaxID=3459516 RepID=UPI00373E8B48